MRLQASIPPWEKTLSAIDPFNKALAELRHLFSTDRQLTLHHDDEGEGSWISVTNKDKSMPYAKITLIIEPLHKDEPLIHTEKAGLKIALIYMETAQSKGRSELIHLDPSDQVSQTSTKDTKSFFQELKYTVYEAYMKKSYPEESFRRSASLQKSASIQRVASLYLHKIGYAEGEEGAKQLEAYKKSNPEFAKKWDDMNEEYKDVVKDRAKELAKTAARLADTHMAMFHTKEEGGTKEFEEWKAKQPASFQEEWDENTEKYKDVVKNKAKEKTSSQPLMLRRDYGSY